VWLACLVLGACASDHERPIDPARDLYAPSGSRRARAIQAVAAARETGYVPELIDLLDDPDATVRLQAGATLRELTGHDTGYRPFMPRAERETQMQAWRAWWAAHGTGQATSGQDASGQDASAGGAAQGGGSPVPVPLPPPPPAGAAGGEVP
jgi:HEAT repeat protein